jgi:two-component system chemotaxis response regulator CheY
MRNYLYLFTPNILKQEKRQFMGRILVVDDTLFMRTLLKNILTTGGHEIVGEAEDGDIGVAKYQELKPDIVTMDVVMPKMNGIEALKAIKNLDSNAKVIMCTAVGQEQMVKLAIKSGARGYIVKPFQAPKVLEEIGIVLGA